MALLDWISSDHDLRLAGDAVRLRPHRSGDFEEWAALRARSRAFLQPWEPTWPADDLTRAAFRRRIALYARDRDLGQGHAFFVFREEGGALVGGVNLRNVMRGVAQSAQIGYWAGQAFTRQGHISAGVQTVTRFAFRSLGLHRVEAACCTDNDASRHLLLKVGFHEEGLARGYLKINGKWRDHLLFGLIADDPAGR